MMVVLLERWTNTTNCISDEDANHDGLKEVICPAGHSFPLAKSIVRVQSLCAEVSCDLYSRQI